MRFLFTFLSLFPVAARRLWNHRLLMSCLLVGLVTAVGLLSSIPSTPTPCRTGCCAAS
jgi:hypothetical protein